MKRRPTASKVRQCLEAFTDVDTINIPEDYPVTVYCEEPDGTTGFLYGVRREQLGQKRAVARKWIRQDALEKLLKNPRKLRGDAVTLGQAITDMEFARLGPGYRRGMVMSCWKAKVCKVTATKAWHDELDRAWLTGQRADKESDAYRHPMLVIRMMRGSMWIPELSMQRKQVLWAINDQFEGEFLRDVRIK